MTEREFIENYYAERRGTHCLKWDALQERFGDADLISMWVADMDFRAPECVVEAIKRRADLGIYGYSQVPDSYYEAVIDWEYRHHGYQVKKEWIRISPGIVSAIYWSVAMYTQPGDAVALLTPVYYPFHNAVRDHGRKLVTCDLDYEEGIFTFDPRKFEKMIAENRVRMYIMSSPQNPAGRVWRAEELKEMLDICRKYDVLVLSDEIHQDLVFGENRHIPTAIAEGGKYKDRLITCFASSKTFNLATCLTSTIVIENEELRRIWDEFIKKYYSVETNVFGLAAVEAALRGGEPWYEDLKKVLYANYEIVKEEMRDHPNVYISPLEGTYLVLMDLRRYVPEDGMREFVQDRCRLAVDYGEWFGENWHGFIRLNMGTHPDIVRKAVVNIKKNLALIGK